MSGALSIPFIFLGVFNAFSQKDIFYLLAIVSLFVVAYRTWIRIRDISLERPLRYKNINITVTGNDLRFGIMIKNEGNKLLKYKVTRCSLEVDTLFIPQGSNFDSGSQSIEANEQLVHFYGATISIKPNRFPLVVVMDFLIEYDNAPPLRVRKMGRRIRYEITSLAPPKSTDLILSHTDEP